MVDFKLTSPISPMSFSLDGYQVVVMPMITDKVNEWQKAQAKSQKAEPADEPQTEGEQAEPEPKPKKAKKPVTAK
jgi:hypothetical protein